MQAFKDAKRRIVQSAAEGLGKAERVKKDEEQMKEAVDGFKTFETEVKTLYDNLKATQVATAKWTERNLQLAESMSSFFSDEGGPLRGASYHMSTSALRAHEIVQRSAVRVLEERGVSVLESLINEKFPAIKKKITEHNNLEMDVSAYTRRAKAMGEKKQPSDPDMVKLREKLERSTATYDQCHSELLNELQRMVREKHSTLRPVFVATLAAYSELQSVLSDEFSEAMKEIDGPDVQDIRKEISSLVESGGPPTEPTNKSHISMSAMKNLFKPGTGSSSFKSGNASLNTSTNDASSSFKDRSFGSYTAKTSNKESSFNPAQAAASKSAPPPPPAPASEMFNPQPEPEPEPVSEPQHREPEPEPVIAADPISSGEGLSGGGGSGVLTPGVVCEAIFDYDGPDPGDLSFKTGEKITMQVEVSPGWWNGTRELDGSYGLFPETYVKRVE